MFDKTTYQKKQKKSVARVAKGQQICLYISIRLDHVEKKMLLGLIWINRSLLIFAFDRTVLKFKKMFLNNNYIKT